MGYPKLGCVTLSPSEISELLLCDIVTSGSA
ncbi:Uncharacterised protein [Vibrio cholerae]|nr:Uncharacterised protein [Vibrio cholerae]